MGLTAGADIGGLPGVVMMSKFDDGSGNGGPIVFSATDLFGTWRIYLHRVDSKFASSTTQIGTTTFSQSGLFSGGTLVDASTPPVTTMLTTGNLAIDSANGSVTGFLAAGTAATAPRYTITGTMRATKDLITGVLTANVSADVSYGLVTMVRDVSFFDLSQPAYSVVEGNSLTVTVKRTGNATAPATVGWAATGGTASPGDLASPTTGTLQFPAGVTSATFTVKTVANTLVDGNRSVNLVLSNPTGPGAMLGMVTSAPLTILDDDRTGTVKLSAATYAVAETGKSVPIVIQRTGTNLASGVTVQFAITDGTAHAGVDYTPVNTSVLFSAGVTSVTVPVPIRDNTYVDGSRTFTFTLTGVVSNGNAVTPAPIGSPASATVTIGDADVAGSLQFGAAAYSVLEGNVSTITVTRTGGAASGVLVDFATADGTAIAGQNYTANSSTLTFNAGNTSATVQIATLNDGVITGDNTVRLSLSNARNADTFTGAGSPTLGAIKSAVLTIKDAQKGVQFASSNYSVSETAGMATVTVVRTGPLADTATVRYSTADGSGVAGTNYVPASGVLTFAPNGTTQSFQVKILPDKVVTGSRTVLLLLSGANSSVAPPVALGPRRSAVLTINDADVAGTVKMAAATASVSEAAGAAVVTIARSGGAAGAVSVSYATCDATTSPGCTGTAQAGIDYQTAMGTVTFGPGETTKTVQVVVNNDSIVNGSRTFTVALSNQSATATLGTPGQTLVTITDDEQGGAVALSAATFTATEPASGNGSATITLKRTGSNLADGASVILLTGSGTATPGVNYVPLASTVVFNGSDASVDVPLTVLADPSSMGTMTVPVMLTGAAGGATLGTPASGVVTIVRANKSFQFSAPVYSVIEGGTATMTVLRAGPTTAAASVKWTANASDASVFGTPTSGTLSFAAGASSASFTIATLATVPSGNRSVTLTLSPVTAGYTLGPPATLNIQDKSGPGTFQFASPAYTVTEGGTATLTVNRVGGVGGSVTVPWASNASVATDLKPNMGSLTFGSGVATMTFGVMAVNNTTLEGTRQFALTLGNASFTAIGTPSTAIVTVLDNENGGVIQFVNATQTVAESVTGGVVNLALARTGTNLAGGIQVDYTITGDTSGIASANSSTVTFAAGATTANIPVTVLNGVSAMPDRQLVVTLSNPRSSNSFTGPNSPTLGAKSALALTITDALPHVEFTAANYSVVEGQAATIGVIRTGAGTGPVTVQYATSDGTGVAGTDYTPASGTLTVTAGAPKTFSVPTFDDGMVVGNRTVMLTLGGATGASVGAPGAALLTILDKESAGAVQFAQASATVLEGGVVHVTVTRSGANLVGGVSVMWSVLGGTASPGTDFTPTSGTLTFDAGVASQGFDLTTVSDGIATGTKTIVLGLGAPAGGAASGSPGATTIYVLDQQQSVGFPSLTASVGETTPTVTIPVVRNGVPDGTVTVQYATADGSAVHGLDYTAAAGTLTFGPGDIVKTITVPIVTANAAKQNGNRAFGVMLSGPSGNASIIGGDTATVTILDFRADLVITSVSPPSGTLTGKAVAAPSTVRNLGPVAAPAFSIGIFMVRADADDATLPGAGTLVATQAVTGLAPGASATFPTQFTIDDGFPAGDYYVSAVANFGLTVPEANTGNDGLSSGQSNPPVAFTISNNLTKFKSANAAFNQTAPPTGTHPGLGPLTAVCNAEGSVNLTGTFQINSQQGDSAQGQANLTGTLNDQPVQYTIAFTGTGNDNGSVTATLDSIVFKSLTAPVLTGTGTGSLTGTLQDRTLVASLSGEITGSVGDCVFTGTLSAQAQTSFSLRTGTGRDDAGTFGSPTGSTGTPFDQTPVVSYPLFPHGAGVEFDVFFDSDYPDPSAVRVTGPPGSGISNQAANSQDSDVGNDHGRYRTGNQRGPIPGGQWSVLYKGQTHTFTLPPFNANASWVVVLPTAHVDADGNLASISWQYLRGNGSAFTGVPSNLAGITAKVQVNNSSGDNPKSGLLSPSTTSFDIVAAGFSPPEWNQVQGITFDYTDIAGNLYEQQYNKAFSIQIVPQLEHIYQNLGPGDPCSGTAGCVQRNLNVFINVPSGSVNRQPCPLPPPAILLTAQLAPPYWVQIQNHDSANGVTNTALPYSDPTCIDYTGTTTFNNSGTPTDIFSIITDLDTAGPGDTPVSVTVGAQFDVSISTNLLNNDPTAQRSTTVVSVEAASATAADVIDLSGPTGFTLADAHLGRPMTISWTRPTFPVLDLSVNPNVYVSSTSAGVFCSVNMNNLDPNATQATFTFPTTCQGQAVQQANVCVFYGGVNGETSDACWFWIAMPDLTITTVNSPPTGTVSSPIPVTATVFNSGSVDAGNFQVGFFISPTNVPGSGTMFGAVDVAGLGAGMVAGVPGPSLFIPANTPPGTYFISAVADINNTVGESNESNNGRTSSTQITIH